MEKAFLVQSTLNIVESATAKVTFLLDLEELVSPPLREMGDSQFEEMTTFNGFGNA